MQDLAPGVGCSACIEIGQVFRWLQIASAAFMAFSHGSNDGQKFIGALTLALVLAGGLPRRPPSGFR